MSSSNWPPVGGKSAYWGDSVDTAGSLPASGEAIGQVIFVRDEENFYSWDGASWSQVTDSTADVGGPGSSTDNAIARFDGATGKTIQNSVVTLDDTGAVTGMGINADNNTITNIVNSAVKAGAGIQFSKMEGLTASRLVVTDGSGFIVITAVTSTEAGFLAGVTSAIQTQIDSKLNLSGGTLTGDLTLAGNPDSALKAATKQYVDALLDNRKGKNPVRLLSASNITLSGEQTIDGQLTSSDRVGVIGQTDKTENGIYTSNAGAWTRTSDANTWDLLVAATFSVLEGTLYKDTGWICLADDGGTLGVDDLEFVQIYGNGTYSADGQAIILTGTQFSFQIDGATLSQSGSGAKVADGGITNTQISGSAAIARTKIGATGARRIVVNDASGVMTDNAVITASRALQSDANGLPQSSATTSTELGHVSGVTSAIQTQIDNVRATRGNVAVNSNVTLTDKRVHFVDTTASRSLVMPAASADLFLVVKDSTNGAQQFPITMTTPGSEKIDGEDTALIDWEAGSLIFVSDGVDYFII